MASELYTEIKGVAALKHALANDLDLTDPETVFALIEGESNLVESCEAVLERIDEDEILVEGLDAKIKQLQARKASFESSIERKRNLILMAIELMPTDKYGKRAPLRLPTATISAKATPRKLVVKDEAVIPSVWWKRGDPVLDKAGLKEALTRAVSLAESADTEEAAAAFRASIAQEFQGVALDNGGVSLTIRRR